MQHLPHGTELAFFLFTVKSRVFYKTLLGAIASVKAKLSKGCSITPQGVFHYTHRYGGMKRTLASLHH